jgi:hypothetical protein
MALPAYKTVGTDDIDLQKIQDNSAQVFEQITSRVILDGLLITDQRIVAGTALSIPHLLNRTLLGYIIVKKSANSVVWDSQASNTLTNKFLILNASATVTVTVWVF